MNLKKTLLDFMNSEDNQLVVTFHRDPWEAEGMTFLDQLSVMHGGDQDGGVYQPFVLLKRRLGQHAYLLYAIDNGDHFAEKDSYGKFQYADEEGYGCHYSCENGRISPTGEQTVMWLLVYSPGRKEILQWWTKSAPYGGTGLIAKEVHKAFGEEDLLSKENRLRGAKRLNDKYLELLHAKYNDDELLSPAVYTCAFEDCIDTIESLTFDKTVIHVSTQTGEWVPELRGSPDLFVSEKGRNSIPYATNIGDCYRGISVEELDRFYSFQNEEEYIDDALRRLLAEIPANEIFEPGKDPAATTYTHYLHFKKRFTESRIGQKIRDIAIAVNQVSTKTVQIHMDDIETGATKVTRVPAAAFTAPLLEVFFDYEYDESGDAFLSDWRLQSGEYGYVNSFSVKSITKITSRGKTIYEVKDSQH